MAAKRATMPVRMEAATLEKVTVDGKASGSATLDVKTAGASASGLVHKYIVMHQQNARRVSHFLSLSLLYGILTSDGRVYLEFGTDDRVARNQQRRLCPFFSSFV
jgi:hypothetical protein